MEALDAVDFEGTVSLLNYGYLPIIALRRLELTRLAIT